MDVPISRTAVENVTIVVARVRTETSFLEDSKLRNSVVVVAKAFVISEEATA